MRKSVLPLALATCIALLATGVTMAQSDTVLRAQVPFGFEASGMTLPAGEYQIRWNLLNATIELQGEDRKGILLLANPAYDRNNKTPRLVFNRYGNKYFLSEIWTIYDTGRVLPISRHEK